MKWIQFYVLLSPCLSFLLFFNLDMFYEMMHEYVRGLSCKPNICVLIHILTKGDIGAVKPV